MQPLLQSQTKYHPHQPNLHPKQSSNPLYYQEFLPTPALQEYIACYWLLYIPNKNSNSSVTQSNLLPGAPIEYPIVPDGCIDILFLLKPESLQINIFITQPQTQLQIAPIYPQGIIWGIRIWPGQSYNLLGVSAEVLSEAFLPLHAINLKAEGIEQILIEMKELSSLKQQLITWSQNWISQLLKQHYQEELPALLVKKLWQHIETIKIQDFVSLSGYSERQLRRVLRKHTGYSPKQLGRVLRFQAILHRLNHEKTLALNWGELAHVCGYHDQAHCIHEFKQFSGITPHIFAERLTEKTLTK